MRHTLIAFFKMQWDTGCRLVLKSVTFINPGRRSGRYLSLFQFVRFAGQLHTSQWMKQSATKMTL